MRILVTGSEGFIGSHLVELLAAEGIDVVAAVQYNSFERIGWLEDLDTTKNITISTFDVRDYDMCRQLVSKVDTVIHLAALIGIPYSYRAIQSYLETNIFGTRNICHASLELGIKRVLIASTSEVYGSALFTPITEEHPLQAQSPYSASKIAADAIATSYANSFGLPLTIFRPFNAYGPRQSRRAIISHVISQCLSDSEDIEVGNLAPTRDFTFVKDTVKAIFGLTNHEVEPGTVFNIGTGSEISIAGLVNLIQSILETNKPIRQDAMRVRPQSSEVLRLVCDSTKLQNATGFRAMTDLKSGLTETIEWFSNNSHSKYYRGVEFVD